MVNDLLPDAANQTRATNPAIQRLLAIPFLVTEDLYAVTISQSYVAPAALEAGSRSLRCCQGWRLQRITSRLS
jgi:hypothetical protein